MRRDITLSPLMSLTIRNFYKEPLMSHILGHSSTTFSTISHFYWYVFNQGHQLWYWGYPQTENRSKILLNDLMVCFLLEATLELILTGDAKCSSLTADTVLHLGVLPDGRLSITVMHLQNFSSFVQLLKNFIQGVRFFFLVVLPDFFFLIPA